MSNYFMSVKDKNGNYQTHVVPKEVSIYVKQLDDKDGDILSAINAAVAERKQVGVKISVQATKK